MYAELITFTPNAEITIERAMRVCHGGDCDPKNKPNTTFIQNIIKLGHESPLEHASATFKIGGVSRALTHQLVRHRIASYTQKSQRYCKEDPFEYVIPDPLTNEHPELVEDFKKDMSVIQEMYNKWIKAGLKREDARYVLPNACCTEIWVTMNFREFRNFIKLRSDKHAQWEIRELSNMIVYLLYEQFPIIFEDLFVKVFPDGIDTLDHYDENGRPIFSKHIGPIK